MYTEKGNYVSRTRTGGRLLGWHRTLSSLSYLHCKVHKSVHLADISFKLTTFHALPIALLTTPYSWLSFICKLANAAEDAALFSEQKNVINATAKYCSHNCTFYKVYLMLIVVSENFTTFKWRSMRDKPFLKEWRTETTCMWAAIRNSTGCWTYTTTGTITSRYEFLSFCLIYLPHTNDYIFSTAKRLSACFIRNGSTKFEHICLWMTNETYVCSYLAVARSYGLYLNEVASKDRHTF